MEYRAIGQRQISALTLGGAGIAGSWGERSEAEAEQTVRMAFDAGITAYDVAPMYSRRAAERIMGRVFSAQEKSGLFVSSKCGLGDIEGSQVYDQLRASLLKSLDLMGIDRLNLFIYHSNLRLDTTHSAFRRQELMARFVTPLSTYFDFIVPAFERLQKEGLIEHWGITGSGEQQALIQAIEHTTKPHAVQAVINAMHSPGGLNNVRPEFDPVAIYNACLDQEVAVLGIRAVQAGALTASMDRNLPEDDPDLADFRRAAPFRDLAAEWGMTPSALAYQYALSVPDVSSVVLGVKNPAELQESLDAEQAKRLSAEQMQQIEACF
ncbi:MAG: aldo/keto reductase [Gammaproteobacteria bacterium]